MKDLKISKELLSEVLKLEVVKHSLFNKTNNSFNITYMQSEDSLKSSWMPINIYEFAFKCKEWIVTQGYGIKTETYDYVEDDSFSGTYWYIIRLRAKNWKDGGCPNCGANATEVEAIIKACEWVLKEQNNDTK